MKALKSIFQPKFIRISKIMRRVFSAFIPFAAFVYFSFDRPIYHNSWNHEAAKNEKGEVGANIKTFFRPSHEKPAMF